LFDKNSGLEVLKIQDKQLGFDSTPTNIRGESIKLKKLGWSPFNSIENILDDLSL
jgi:hypothetical protein